MKHLILGTAGHIDHGKTSLVKALTGVDTDRLKEEKARGITIELGFAHLELPGDLRFGIVDVPGHERFVRTMVAGVGGMDLVLLVIAADEGIMPQTREHLEICQLLGVKRGIVVLTKKDMVEPDWLDLVTEEVRDYLAESFLAGAPIVSVSSRSGDGIDNLKAELTKMAKEIEQKRVDSPFRLPVDRVFTVTGFGTVVTGTLLSGSIAVGDEVEILPSGIACRVRGVQSFGSKVEKGGAGERLAVNLQGVDHTDVQRGDVVVPKGLYKSTSAVDVRLNYLASMGKELKHRAGVRLHSATYEVPAKIILFDRDALQPGESAYVQLRLDHPVLLLPGDPFVLRTYSPQATLGGGTVLDPAPPRRRRRSAEALALLEAVESGVDQERIRLLVESSLLSGISIQEMVNRSGMSGKRIEAALAPLLSSGAVLQVVKEPRIFLSKDAFAQLKQRLSEELQEYLQENPMQEGIGKEELKSRIPRRSDARFFGPVLSSLEKDGLALSDRELVKLPGRKVGVTQDQASVQRALEEALTKAWFEPPTLKELCDLVGATEKQVLDHANMMFREGRVAKIKGDIFYAPGAVNELRDKLVAHLKEKGEITPPEFRDLTGLSRKFMIPLLEYFDQEKLTIRMGDKRVLRKG
ncbi:selenocysteine-specific translation elongation factor [Geomonas sp. Red69]|uniref:Selenocysteine-specific elongation factor n=1 Tax=Geomonas diazotrophica TaxID=2843197 RepID=A0ABX8JJV5_9BACT|nr:MULTISPECIES: selenocysteine-specific translation elongation factor [Geomonas]MBU5638753.1 selenocysteine-specific translation elongation factor [Geomonas diazotrophica]QWV97406.1 selenocysteine-specific translation elongation factor [Geomonas nitrogeniifigens]QXE86564.1 selenocysteine-specific translation elongation factor [Geomonas nitrogeniifigens]